MGINGLFGSFICSRSAFTISEYYIGISTGISGDAGNVIHLGIRLQWLFYKGLRLGR